MKLLIADDDPVFRKLLGAYARQWGYEPVLACDGEEAWIELNRADAPRLALLDWVMPGADGVELCRRVRREPLSHYVYVVLLTARTASLDLIAGLEAGADDFVAKPVDFEQLRLRIAAGARIVNAESRQLASRLQTELLVGHLRGISGRLFRIQEDERRAIARQLHEEVAQDLSGALLALGLAGAAESTSRKLAEASVAIKEGLSRVRSLAYRLYPLLLDDIGLYAALRHYAHGLWADAAGEIELRLPDALDNIPTDIAVAIFRIAQEAVELLGRVSAGGRAVIELARGEAAVHLEVRGPGTPSANETLEAISILSMRERAEQMAARLDVARRDGVVIVTADFPLSGRRPAELGRAYAD